MLNLENQRFGRLTAIRPEGKSGGYVSWLCKCDCGNEKIVNGHNLRTGTSRSCGCLKYEREYDSLLGLRFGKLIVTEYLGSRDNARWWKCLCDCGNTKEIPTERLRSKRGTKSCGCLTLETAMKTLKSGNRKYSSHKLFSGEAQFNSLYYHYSINAQRAKREFSISKNEFRILITSDCHYCGNPPSSIARGKNSNGEFIYNGIDRVDNSKGYELDNCVPCCKMCNHAKHTVSYEEFIDYLHRIARKYKDVQ